MAERVLVVEDDPNTLEIVELYLRRDGYEVLAARDGMEGRLPCSRSKARTL